MQIMSVGVINNGNKTEWNHTCTSDKQNRTTSRRESDLLITSMVRYVKAERCVTAERSGKFFSFPRGTQKASYIFRGGEGCYFQHTRHRKKPSL